MGLINNPKGTILLLCSEPDVLTSMRQMLTAVNYLVLPAGNLAAAIDQLQDITPDLLIVRPYLEGISGLDAALYLRDKCNGLRVLMANGLPDDEALLSEESVRGVDIFPAPFSASEFLEKVAAMLASSSATRAQ